MQKRRAIMYEDIQEIEQRFTLSDFPLNIAIEPSNYCNLNCIMCAHNRLTRKKGAMDIRLYKKIIDEVIMENPDTRIWLDYYGEPLLQKFRLFYMIDYARKRGIKNIDLNTNATVMDEEMTEMLLDAGIEFISFDCDGFSKEVYESIRVGAKRDVVYKNIEYFLKRKRERGLNIPIVEVKIMEMEENKLEIDQVVSYWRTLGAWTCIRRLISWGGNINVPSLEENITDRIACGNAVGTLAITWNGIATNCVMDIDAQYPSGDVNSQSIKDIWLKRNEILVKRHIKHQWNDLPDICKTCNDWMIVGENRFDEYGTPIFKNYGKGKMLTGEGQ